jgi:hypothetical protein
MPRKPCVSNTGQRLDVRRAQFDLRVPQPTCGILTKRPHGLAADEGVCFDWKVGG